MEYIEGGELFKILKDNDKFPEEVVKFIAAEILLGLEYLHKELKVSYRDIKPENIMITGDGHAKLIDFGMSKKMNFFGETIVS